MNNIRYHPPHLGCRLPILSPAATVYQSQAEVLVQPIEFAANPAGTFLSPNGRNLRARNEKTWIRTHGNGRRTLFSLLSEFLQKLLAARNRIDRSVQTT
jgi:hypothetical protein